MSNEPNVFIQWKGTVACMDLHCTCGADGHIDEDFAYAVQCWQCGLVWEMPTSLTPTLTKSPVVVRDAVGPDGQIWQGECTDG